jgi:hypothetical protein
VKGERLEVRGEEILVPVECAKFECECRGGIDDY